MCDFTKTTPFGQMLTSLGVRRAMTFGGRFKLVQPNSNGPSLHGENEDGKIVYMVILKVYEYLFYLAVEILFSFPKQVE